MMKKSTVNFDADRNRYGMHCTADFPLPSPGRCPHGAQQRCGRCGLGCSGRPCLSSFCRPFSFYFTVTFEAGGGVPAPQPQLIPYGGVAAMPDGPVRVGYILAGWYQSPDFSGNAWDFNNDTVTSNLVLYARWEQDRYTVTFDTNGGVPVPAPQLIRQGEMAAMPAGPVREGYYFGGWYQSPDFSGSAWDFNNDTVTSNITLYARWASRIFVVVFVANGGVPVPAFQQVPEGGLAIRPADPARSEYTFSGWYPTWDFSGDPWDFDTDVVTQNTIIYARWVLSV